MTHTQTPNSTPKFQNIDDYHLAQTVEVREILEELRGIILETVPELKEVISYNMPAFKQHKVLVYYAAYAHHIGFYPTSEPIEFFKEQLKPYKTSKGAIQFPIGKPLPVELIRLIVTHRAQQDAASDKKVKF